MRSTGEVMGVGESFAEAYAKSQLAADVTLPRSGRVLLSVRKSDKGRLVQLAYKLIDAGFTLDATHGTAKTLRDAGIACREVNKVYEGRPNILDFVKNGDYDFIINTTEEGAPSRTPSSSEGQLSSTRSPTPRP